MRSPSATRRRYSLNRRHPAPLEATSVDVPDLVVNSGGEGFEVLLGGSGAKAWRLR
jgi:hypothetical protein